MLDPVRMRIDLGRHGWSASRLDPLTDPHLGRILVGISSGDAEHQRNGVVGRRREKATVQRQEDGERLPGEALVVPSGSGWLRAMRTHRTAAFCSRLG